MKHGSLFSGIGGFDIAARNVGFRNVWNCEINELCKNVLKARFPESIQFTDIRTLSRPPKVDVLSGGFPCQDISYARTWTGNGTNVQTGIRGKRSGLWKEFARIISEVTPSYVVIENVPALAKNGLNILLQDLANIGYNAEWTLLSASRFGAPHLRKRIWIVAYPIGIRWQQKGFVFSKEFSETIQYSPKWEPSRAICRKTGKKTLPPDFGIYDGLPRELDDAGRIEALGNSIVPDVAEFIFRLIKAHNDRTI